MGLRDSALDAGPLPADAIWPPPPPPSDAGPWPAAAGSGLQHADADNRAGRYFIAGSLAVFLAGLGTAALIAGGEPQAQAPAPPVAPSVDVVMVPHTFGNGQPHAVRHPRPDSDQDRSPGLH